MQAHTGRVTSLSGDLGAVPSGLAFASRCRLACTVLEFQCD